MIGRRLESNILSKYIYLCTLQARPKILTNVELFLILKLRWLLDTAYVIVYKIGIKQAIIAIEQRLQSFM